MRSVICHHCQAPVTSRQQLAVGGRALLPLHVACYSPYARLQPWYRKPGWPVNRWTSLLLFNGVLLGLVALLHAAVGIPDEKRSGLLVLLCVINAWLVLARVVSFMSLERHLPE